MLVRQLERPRLTLAATGDDRWLRKKHPRVCDAVQVPAKGGSEHDHWRSTTVLPYLKALYEPPQPVHEDGDSVAEDGRSGDGLVAREHNNNEEELLRSAAHSRAACRASKASAFLSCLGMRKDKCKQS